MKYLFIVLLTAGCAKQSNNDDNIKNLQERLVVLENEVEHSYQTIDLLQTTITQLQSGYQNNDLSFQAQIDALSSQIIEQQKLIAKLKTGLPTIEVVKLCRDHGGTFAEIAIRLADGSIVAFPKGFFLGLQRNKTYDKKDGHQCKFSVTSEGILCDAEKCH